MNETAVKLVDIEPEIGAWDLEVAENQKQFVASRDIILARAYMFRKYRAQAYWIYAGENGVGMVLYTDSPDTNSYDFSQIFIDRNFQKRGYGTAAVKLVLEKMKQDGKYNKVTTCYVEGNIESKKLFEKFGFVETEQAYDEINMELEL